VHIYNGQLIVSVECLSVEYISHFDDYIYVLRLSHATPEQISLLSMESSSFKMLISQ
jgi:hypothetical protein